MINSRMVKVAKELRKKTTDAEDVLWGKIRNRKINNLKFRRQFPLVIGVYNFVADFYCSEKKLIIEIDCEIHSKSENKEYDEFREDIIKEAGFKVLRFVNRDVLLRIDDVLEKNKVVTFSQKTSRGCGGTTTDVTDIIHPENIKMLEHVAKFLDDPLIGVDFIIEDITKSWKEEQHCGIIECNSLPFIDLHHYPLFGKPVNVAGKLWDLVLPESKIN